MSLGATVSSIDLLVVSDLAEVAIGVVLKERLDSLDEFLLTKLGHAGTFQVTA